MIQKIDVRSVVFLAVLLISATAFGQSEFKEVASGDTFHASILKAASDRIEKANGAEKLQARRDFWKLRTAMLLPRMRDKVKELVVMQINLNIDAGQESPGITIIDGRVEVATIDWDSLLAFLEKLIPLIITLIGLFG